MKKITAKISAIILALALCISMVGCSADVSTVLLMKKAYKTISELESLSFTINTELSGQIGLLPVELEAKADSRCILENGIMQSQVEADLGKLGTFRAPVYLSAGQDSADITVGFEKEGSTIWYSRQIDLPQKQAEAESSIDLGKLVDMLEENPEMLSLGETETIDGRDALPMNIKLPMPMVLELAGLSYEQAEGKELLIKLWLDEESLLPIRISSDLSELAALMVADSGYDSLPELGVDKLMVQVDITGYNDVDGISLPSAS